MGQAMRSYARAARQGGHTTTLGPGATIDLADSDCLRLGTPGSSAASFSLTFWLKAGSESDCFAVPIVRGVRGDRATVIGQKVDTLAQTGWRMGKSVSVLACPPLLLPLSLSLHAHG